MKLSLNNIAYTMKKNRVLVHLLCRDEKGDFHKVDVEHRPYCYLSVKDARVTNRPVSVTEMAKEQYYSYMEKEPLVKLFFRTPPDVGSFRRRMEEKGIKTYEADIPFTRRFMVDRDIKCGFEYADGSIKPLEEEIDSNIRVMVMDMEVKSPKTLDIITIIRWAKHPIVVISYWDSKDKIIRTITCRKTSQKYYFSEKTEKGLIKRFIEEVNRINPDVIVGYNIEGFDIPYLMRRCQHHKIGVGKLSPLNRSRWDDRKKRWIIKGRSILDYARLYRDYIGRELRISWYEALDTLAERYLGIHKVKIEDFEETWNKTPEVIEKRAQLDVDIIVRIEERLNLISLFDTVRKTIGCEFDDVFFKSVMADVATLRYLKGKGALPNKARRESEEVGYRGAYIVEPNTGVYRDVVVMDFGDFYPHIILLYNISPDTIIPPQKGAIGGKYSFSTTKIGILPSLIRKYLRLKTDIKKQINVAKKEGRTKDLEALKIRHEAMKRVILFYGTFAYSSRLPSIEVTEAISLAAQYELKKVIEYLKTIKASVLYGDTDSVFISVPEDRTAEEVAEKVKAFLPRELEMELKMVFKRVVFLSKKRYIGKTSEGEIVRKGIQMVRSDIENYLAKVQDALLLLILNDVPSKHILIFLRKVYSNIDKGRLGYQALAKPVQLKKRLEEYKVEAYHVQGIKYTEKYLKKKFYSGMKPRILRISRTPTGFPKTKWLAINRDMVLPEGFELDLKHYTKRLKQVLKDILPLIGLEWKELEYRKLDSFLDKKT